MRERSDSDLVGWVPGVQAVAATGSLILACHCVDQLPLALACGGTVVASSSVIVLNSLSLDKYLRAKDVLVSPSLLFCALLLLAALCSDPLTEFRDHACHVVRLSHWWHGALGVVLEVLATKVSTLALRDETLADSLQS